RRRRRRPDGRRHRQGAVPVRGHRAQLPVGGDREDRGEHQGRGGPGGDRARLALTHPTVSCWHDRAVTIPPPRRVGGGSPAWWWDQGSGRGPAACCATWPVRWSSVRW